MHAGMSCTMLFDKPCDIVARDRFPTTSKSSVVEHIFKAPTYASAGVWHGEMNVQPNLLLPHHLYATRSSIALSTEADGITRNGNAATVGTCFSQLTQIGVVIPGDEDTERAYVEENGERYLATTMHVPTLAIALVIETSLQYMRI